MTTVPDGVEVVRTLAEAAQLRHPPFLVLETLERYLDDQGIGTGALDWVRIGEGQSNVTFRLSLIHISEPTRPY